jgi:hypothetical protein
MSVAKSRRYSAVDVKILFYSSQFLVSKYLPPNCTLFDLAVSPSVLQDFEEKNTCTQNRNIIKILKTENIMVLDAHTCARARKVKKWSEGSMTLWFIYKLYT